jgi:hypothetical protein
MAEMIAHLMAFETASTRKIRLAPTTAMNRRTCNAPKAKEDSLPGVLPAFCYRVRH